MLKITILLKFWKCNKFISSPGKGKWKNDMVNKSNDVIKPKIIVVPILKNVEETIAGITSKKEKGLKIPPVK